MTAFASCDLDMTPGPAFGLLRTWCSGAPRFQGYFSSAASGCPVATALTGRLCSQSDHSIRIDDQHVIDGRDRAKDTATFSPCHMNHSGRHANVGRHTQRRAGRVAFYTLRDVQARLLFDYCHRLARS